jgi:two-component SAPR family response regulator
MVRTELLIEDLWSEDAAVKARKTLQATVSRLRRSLGDPALVTGTAAGYTLNVDPGAVDALEVVRLVDFTARPGRADGRLGRSHVGWTVTDMYVTQARAVVRGAA